MHAEVNATGRALRRSLGIALLTIVLAFSARTEVHAQDRAAETQVMVRAVSNDAKIIGSGVGGARVVIQDVETGEVLDEGIQEGGTGSTERIVQAARERDATVFDTDGAAGYLATIRIDRPTLVDITAIGPLGSTDHVARSSKRMLLLPGEDVLGEGVILELNGFTVELASADVAGRTVDVRAEVTMLCGCPTEPGGLWDADDILVTARLLDAGAVVASSTLDFAGTTSTFAGSLTAPEAGTYVLEITASEPAEGNFGAARDRVVVR